MGEQEKPSRETTKTWTRSRRAKPLTGCQNCGGAMPAAATTGRPRVYCSESCRKQAYEKRRARKPDATRIKLVEKTVVETVETRHTVNAGHDITQCTARVTESPRASANVLANLSFRVAHGDLLSDPKWEPTKRALEALLQTIADPRRRR